VHEKLRRTAPIGWNSGRFSSRRLEKIAPHVIAQPHGDLVALLPK